MCGRPFTERLTVRVVIRYLAPRLQSENASRRTSFRTLITPRVTSNILPDLPGPDDTSLNLDGARDINSRKIASVTFTRAESLNPKEVVIIYH